MSALAPTAPSPALDERLVKVLLGAAFLLLLHVCPFGQETALTTAERFLPQSPESFSYDDDGNLLSDGRWTNSWDAQNRLIRQVPTAAALAAGVENLRLSFAYDYAGRRIPKEIEQWADGAYTPRAKVLFLYDGWKLVAEVLADGGLLIRTYSYGSDLSGGDAAAGIGGLLFTHYPIEGRTFAVASDGQGNVRTLQDMADGQRAALYEYGPFGEALRVSGLFAEANPMRWSSKFTDPETGWSYYGHRYYLPAQGRWASRDPLGETGGLNLYTGIANNPAQWVDPTGRQVLVEPVVSTTEAGTPSGADFAWVDARPLSLYAAPASTETAGLRDAWFDNLASTRPFDEYNYQKLHDILLNGDSARWKYDIAENLWEVGQLVPDLCLALATEGVGLYASLASKSVRLSALAPRPRGVLAGGAGGRATQLELDFGQSLPWQRGESGLVIGRHADLSTPGALRAGEYRLSWLDVRDSLGDAANLSVNQAKINAALDLMLPVRDASPLSDIGSPYLNLERSSALGRNWFYGGGQWLPPAP